MAFLSLRPAGVEKDQVLRQVFNKIPLQLPIVEYVYFRIPFLLPSCCTQPNLTSVVCSHIDTGIHFKKTKMCISFFNSEGSSSKEVKDASSSLLDCADDPRFANSKVG